MLYFAYPTCGLSHCLAQDKQLDSPRRDILTKSISIWTGHNTPKVDVSVAFSSELLICEIYTSKITFVNVLYHKSYNPLHPCGLPESVAKVGIIFDSTKFWEIFLCRVILISMVYRFQQQCHSVEGIAGACLLSFRSARDKDSS